jgi:hypothetical protein
LERYVAPSLFSTSAKERYFSFRQVNRDAPPFSKEGPGGILARRRTMGAASRVGGLSRLWLRPRRVRAVYPSRFVIRQSRRSARHVLLQANPGGHLFQLRDSRKACYPGFERRPRRLNPGWRYHRLVGGPTAPARRKQVQYRSQVGPEGGRRSPGRASATLRASGTRALTSPSLYPPIPVKSSRIRPATQSSFSRTYSNISGILFLLVKI